MSDILLIVRREFNERVRKKSFIFTTLLMPLLLLALMAAPALIMEYAHGERKRIAVVDESGLVARSLESDGELLFEPTDLTLDRAREELSECFGVRFVGRDVLADPDAVRLYADGAASVGLERNIESQIARILEAEKLKAYRIDDLPAILEAVKTTVRLHTFRNDAAETGAAFSSTVASVAGFVLGIMLYMFLLMYGMMVMHAVIEEKQSRVLEVLVSSVRPFDLMLGKILGIAAVAVVQVSLWGLLAVAARVAVVPSVLPSELEAVLASLDAAWLVRIFGCMLAYVVGGCLFYSAMFAAVGSSVDSVQDAQQLQTPITVPIILSFLLMMAVMNDPDSSLAFWCSLVPFTSPVVMMARIPYDVPWWQVALSLAILYASFVGMVWFAAKIYRVGIFMYGKKPTLRELIRWIRYR